MRGLQAEVASQAGAAPPVEACAGVCGAGWQSLHIHIHDFGRIDRFLLEGLPKPESPFWREAFFIRYWLGGPHVRLRCRPGPEAVAAIERARDYLDHNGFRSTLEPDRFYASYDRHFPEAADRPWFPNGSIQEVDYLPELDRYGGQKGMPVCEHHFCEDSRQCLHIVAALKPSERQQLMFGFCEVYAGVAEAACPGGNVRTQVLTGGGAGALQRVPEVVSMRREAMLPAIRDVRLALAQQRFHPRFVRPLRSRLSTLVEQLLARGVKEVGPILGSLLHMTFNRLGVPPSAEALARYFSLAPREEQ